jgi:4-amino-4-deoxy-L-arabinose transferase-like glycosyltransferase
MLRKLFPNLLILLFLAVWLFFTAITIPNYGITWDEPLYFRAAKSYADWFGLISSGNWNSAFDAKTIDTYWQYNAQHPPLTKLIAGITYTISHKWADQTTAFRLAGLFWYATLLFLVYYISRKIYNRNIAWVAMISTALIPRLFADAHLLELDLPLAVVWLFTTYAFYRGLDDKYQVPSIKDYKKHFGFRISDFGFSREAGWSIICGISFGLAMLTKVMAIFILIPLFLWAQIFYRNKYSNNLFCMFTIGPIIFVLFWPWLWHNTFTRILDYFAFFFLMESPLKTFYFGQAYSSTPWHYPLVMTLVTVPIGILLLALFGIWKSIRGKREEGRGKQNILTSEAILPAKRSSIFHQSDTFGSLLLFNILFFLGFFALPGTLVIDGVRYFLPIFPMLAIFAGLGFYHFRLRISDCRFKTANRKSQILNGIVLIIVFLLPLIAIGTYHPYQLSYYNELVGGIRGATRLGFETTYWGEVIRQNELDWMNKNIPYDAKVKIIPVYPAKNAPIAALSYYPDVILYYQNHGTLRPDINFFASPPYDYLGLVSRQGLFTSSDWYLYQHGNPVYQTSLSGIQLFAIYKLD